MFYFSSVNLVACLIGIFILAPLGVNIGYHRMLTHRAFEAKPWVRNTLATLGALLGAGPPIHWVAMHRLHHRYSDQELDPHNARKGFWYSHILHLFIMDPREDGETHLAKYAPDLLREPYLAWLNKNWLWLAMTVLPALYLAGGLGLVLWAGFVRLVISWHIMWFVNSASHLWGYRNFATNDITVNCWWVALLGAGEGWHNNHHANPSWAKHGLKPWEFDFSFLLIRCMEKLGLVGRLKGSR